MEMTVAQAAKRLGTTSRAVHLGIDSGRIAVARRLDGRALLDDITVEMVRRTSARGRTWDANTTWAALELLETGQTSRVAGTQRSRLKARLRQMTVRQFAHAAQSRGPLVRLRQHDGTSRQLAREVTVSGASALVDAELAEQFRLAAGVSDKLVGYVAQERLDVLSSSFLLERSAEGNVLLRVCENAMVNTATIALDLYELGKTRESSAGAAWLEERLGA